MILHEVEEAAYASACAGARALAWGRGCGAAVQGSCSPPLPPASPHAAWPVGLRGGRLQEQALKVSCWFAPFKNDNRDFNVMIHQEVF